MAMHGQSFRGEDIEIDAVTVLAMKQGVDWSSAIRMMIVRACPENFPPGYIPKIGGRNWEKQKPVWRKV